ncbi:MBL fold metallo-hydrolase [Klebsiella sp. WOUb02]|uniref:MBL fold metallo-hydrolase n=1 Tax=Klebsiella sp. WOUb02 TaxID=3161071 RepID=UPI003CE6AD7B
MKGVKIEIISGLHRKAPAAILLSTPHQRILLDAGGALEPDEAPWPVPADIDAILLSHDHVDHIAGLSRLPAEIPVYCSAVTAQALPAGRNVRPVAVRGQFSLGEITVTTGRLRPRLGRDVVPSERGGRPVLQRRYQHGIPAVPL